MKGVTWRLLSSLLLPLVISCEERSALAPRKSKVLAPAEEEELVPVVPDVDPCLQQIEGVLRGPKLPGAPEYEEHRAEILARARSVPLVFIRRPAEPKGASERVLKFRRELRLSKEPTQTILRILRDTRRRFEERRAIFLSEDYLFASLPLLSLRLSQILRLDHLFDEPLVSVQRGARTFTAVRRDARYWILPSDGNEKVGPEHHEKLANLLLFDRVRTGDGDFSESLAIDFSPLQSKLGFSSAKIEGISKGAVVAQISTYGFKSRALLSVVDSVPQVACESSIDNSPVDLAAARQLWHSDQRSIARIMNAAHEIIERRLPFDEPRTEEGQQDGLLRIHFRKAYREYKNTFEFNGDSYYVFDGYGRPRLPEVCIDFITDAFDWGTGGYWPKRGQKRKRVKGALNFASMGIENPRSVESLAGFATDTPEWFDMVWLDKAEQIKFRHRENFFRT